MEERSPLQPIRRLAPEAGSEMLLFAPPLSTVPSTKTASDAFGPMPAPPPPGEATMATWCHLLSQTGSGRGPPETSGCGILITLLLTRSARIRFPSGSTAIPCTCAVAGVRVKSRVVTYCVASAMRRIFKLPLSATQRYSPDGSIVHVSGDLNSAFVPMPSTSPEVAAAAVEVPPPARYVTCLVAATILTILWLPLLTA